LIWLYAKRVSTISLLSNALVLPLQPYVMGWGTAATLGGLLWLPLGRVLGWGAWLFLAATIWAVEWTARVPYASLDVRPLSRVAQIMVVAAWYAAVSGGGWLLWQTEDRRKEVGQAVRQALDRALSGKRATKLLVSSLALLACLVWLAVATLPDGRLQVSFLGGIEGDATLIREPGGGYLLVNGGGSASVLTSHLGRRLPFWERRLSLVALTDETSHLAGVVPVLERYRVGQILFGSHPCSGAVCQAIEVAVNEQGIAVVEAVDGLTVTLDGAVLRVLRAGEGAAVLRLEYVETCFTLAGGARPEELASLAGSGADLQCAILQVDARAVEDAEGAAFIEAVRPDLVVLVGQGGKETPGYWGGTAVKHVGQGASVTVLSDGQQYAVR
jgi:competence protein ComEC